MTYNGFIFNEHGVCINPENIVITDTGGTRLIVKVCEVPGGWVNGCSYHCEERSQGGGRSAALPSSDWHVVYPTRDDAIRGQLRFFESRYSKYFGKAIREYLTPKTMQLF